jgi:hypothetical protein
MFWQTQLHRARPRHAFWVVALALTIAVLPFVGSATADTLRLKDGKVYQGKLISRDDAKVVFSVHLGSITYTKEFDAADVESIEEGTPLPERGKKADAKSAAPIRVERLSGKGIPYYVLPLHGGVGTRITHELVDDCLSAARRVDAKVVIFDIESPGGSVAELKAILKVLDRYNDLRLVAFVHEAKSAAAILAMACPEIIMADRGQIGAAVPYQLSPEGTPKNIAAKFESSIRADFRAAAERGGHDPLLVEGMMRDDIVLSLKFGRSGAARVVEKGGDKVLKKRGEILTLTSAEAQQVGLSIGTSPDLASCRSLLRIEEWHEGTRHGWKRFRQWAEEIDAASERFSQASQRAFAGLADAEAAAKARHRADAGDGLRRATMNLQQMEELAEKYPGLGDSDSLHALRTRIRAIRQSFDP